MTRLAVERLPAWLLERATLRGNEYAWPVDDIDLVIVEARKAGLVSVGGQLQFRLPSGTAECYWVQVDTYTDVPQDLPWGERVERSAESAARQMQQIRKLYDFVEEGREAFRDALNEYEGQGHSIKEAMCFVWYVRGNFEGG